VSRCPPRRTAAELADMHMAERKQKLTGERKKRQPRYCPSTRSERTHGCKQKSCGLRNTTKLDCIVKPDRLYSHHSATGLVPEDYLES
jgi:hypothetical protein